MWRNCDEMWYDNVFFMHVYDVLPYLQGDAGARGHLVQYLAILGDHALPTQTNKQVAEKHTTNKTKEYRINPPSDSRISPTTSSFLHMKDTKTPSHFSQQYAHVIHARTKHAPNFR